ncbi:Proton-dependent Oligopeptide Transporter (POT) Family [Phytophthora cinnamomi]|uniref:Proton-dependent Oligopeptide Transporter (POT) Family n=1 Tax=Phytophthora cinnamomi TaxID=4785 RepID=UPI00355A62E0|nr:Proton-dependent Oligopeptide Transporter (POT) Family [Phytophthora cinnamomi]
MAPRTGSPSPLLTPQNATPKIVTDYSTQTLSPKPSTALSTKLWEARPSKYSQNIIKKVCVFIFVLTVCEEVASYAVNQSLKNFFQRLGWSNKGSNSMKLTYDSLSQFACIPAGYISDEFLGKFKTLLGAASSSSIGFVLISLAALPSIRSTQSLSKALFCVGLFGGVALNQVCLRALTVSFGGDQFSSTSPPDERARFFSLNFWASRIGISFSYAVFPSLAIHGFGAIPVDYGFVAVYLVGLLMLLIFVGVMLFTRKRYVDVPPTRSALGSVIRVVLRRAKNNFQARMIVLGTVMYLSAFLLNFPAAFLADHDEIGHNISYACGVLTVVATIIYVYYARDSSFIEVIRVLPFNAFNMFWWVCQNQRGNNQTIIQQTDVRLGSSPDASQIPGPTVQIFNPFSGLLFVPLLDKLIYPLYEKYVGKPPSRYGKVLAGYIVAIIAMVWTGCFEIIRRNSPLLTYVDANGETQYIYNDDGGQPMSDIPWWTAVPQYCWVSLATVLIQISTYNIGYTEVPLSLCGMSIALGFFMNSMGSTLLSVFVLLFGKYIPTDLNDGHMEYLYFTLAAVMAVNTFFYVLVMREMNFAMIPPVVADEEQGNESKPDRVVSVA